jgi:hypothetical protein
MPTKVQFPRTGEEGREELEKAVKKGRDLVAGVEAEHRGAGEAVGGEGGGCQIGEGVEGIYQVSGS